MKEIFSNVYFLSLLISFLGGAIFILYFVLKGMRLRNKPEKPKQNSEDIV
jgi:hypothetical protein